MHGSNGLLDSRQCSSRRVLESAAAAAAILHVCVASGMLWLAVVVHHSMRGMSSPTETASWPCSPPAAEASLSPSQPCFYTLAND
jgi:hypothetical protein